MFEDTDGFKKLAELYAAEGAADSFGLYLGAGVNLPTKEVKKLYFDTYSWEDLLRAIYERNMIQYHKSFEQLKADHPDDWPGLAEALIGSMSVEKLVDEIDLIFYHCMPREDKYGRLSKKILDQAPTLHAAISFTARITEKGTFERNPNIGTVITPNYDFFFGAGWTRYQAFREQWKVQTPFSRKKPLDTLRAINYIHGYIPYRFSYRRKLVLTRESYENAYQRDGFARRILENAVRKYHLIFIGTSFSDPPVNKILKDAKSETNESRHFVIERSSISENLKKDFENMGIIPILVEDYADFAAVLEKLYCIGLESNHWEKFGLESDAYWERLKVGPRGKPAE